MRWERSEAMLLKSRKLKIREGLKNAYIRRCGRKNFNLNLKNASILKHVWLEVEITSASKNLNPFDD